MEPRNLLSALFILILVFLLLNNSPQTQNILTTLGTQSTGLIGALQGQAVSNNSVKLAGATHPA